MKRPSTAARDSTLAVVEIGEEKTKYTIHRSLLVAHSEYFKKALSGPWKEAKEGVVTLEDVEPDTFSTFMDWIYTQRLPGNDKGWNHSVDADDDAHVPRSQVARVKALVFGDRVLAPSFYRALRDEVITDLIDYSVCYRSVIYAFDKLASDYPILDLMVETHCSHSSDEEDTTGNGEIERRRHLPNDFLLRVMLRYSRCNTRHDFDELDPCDYHGHASEEEKKECRAGKDAE